MVHQDSTRMKIITCAAEQWGGVMLIMIPTQFNYIEFSECFKGIASVIHISPEPRLSKTTPSYQWSVRNIMQHWKTSVCLFLNLPTLCQKNRQLCRGCRGNNKAKVVGNCSCQWLLHKSYIFSSHSRLVVVDFWRSIAFALLDLWVLPFSLKVTLLSI